MKSSYGCVVEFTAAEIAAGKANSLPVSVSVLNTTTGALSKGNPTGAPVAMATTAEVTAAVAAIAVKPWPAGAAVVLDELRRAPNAAGTIEAGDMMTSTSARTTGATFDAAEAANWTEANPDLVTSVASRTGAVVLAKADVGLSNAENTSDSAKPVSTAQAAAIGLKADTTALTTHTGSTTNPHGVTKAQVGLGSAENTSDAGKPVSTAQATAIGLKADASALTAHTGSTSNPHGVTAAQVGAAATSHAHAQADVTGLTAAISAKQDTLVSGTNIRSVNGSSLIGSGNVSVAADLPGGAATTVTNEGLVTTGAPSIDTTTVSGETIIRWTGSGTFAPPIGVSNVRILVVAGGGGGGVGVGGGGGAGGVRASSSEAVAGSTVVTIGNGGPGRSGDGPGTSGGNSVFGSVTATGGGGGGGWTAAGITGGSGGGGNSGNTANPSVAAAGTGTSGEGNSGGVGLSTLLNAVTGGGGGGAGAAGAAGGTATTDGVGGAGASNDITGTAIFYGGGGGAGLYQVGTVTSPRSGGSGGGGAGNGFSIASVAGTANTGGGGGGAQGVASAAGGSGVVIVRFPTQTRSYQALAAYASDAAAAAGGILIGQFFRDSASGSVRQRAA